MLPYSACSYQAFLCFILLIEHFFWVFGLLLYYFPYCPLVFLCFPYFFALNAFSGLPPVLNTIPPFPTTFLFVQSGCYWAKMQRWDTQREERQNSLHRKQNLRKKLENLDNKKYQLRSVQVKKGSDRWHRLWGREMNQR